MWRNFIDQDRRYQMFIGARARDSNIPLFIVFRVFNTRLVIFWPKLLQMFLHIA